MIYTLHLPIEPTPAARPRVSRKGWSYYPKKYKEFKERLGVLIKECWTRPPIDTPVYVHIEARASKPKTTKLPFPKADWDNFAKAVCDAMNKVVFTDDWLIQQGSLNKDWSDGEGYIIVKVTTV